MTLLCTMLAWLEMYKFTLLGILVGSKEHFLYNNHCSIGMSTSL